MLFRLLKIAIVVFILFFIYRFAVARGWLQSVKIPDQVLTQAPWLKQVSEGTGNWQNPDLEKLSADGLSQIQILGERAKHAGGITQTFVTQAVKVDEGQDKNLSEKAFEYGRYVYCQEVVKQYEAQKEQQQGF